VAYLRARRQGGNPWIDPAFLITAFFGYKYGFGSLATNYWSALSWTDTPGIGTMFERWGIWENLPAACHLFVLAGLGLYIGVSLKPLRVFDALPPLRWNVDTRRFRINLYLYTPPAMILFITGRRVLPVVIRDTALLFGWITWVIVVIAAAEWLRRDVGDRRATSSRSSSRHRRSPTSPLYAARTRAAATPTCPRSRRRCCSCDRS